MRARTLAVVPLLVFVVAAPACELFGQVACAEDEDCPDAIPFCNSDVCEAEADDGRPGRGVDGEGEGEGDGSCSADGDCSGGLCDIDGTFGDAGACLPPAGTEDCASDPEVAGPARAADGPVIFGLEATAFKPGCWSNVTFSFFDREGDVSPTSPGVELVVGGAFQTQSAFSEDGKTFTIGTLCGSVGSSGLAGLLLQDSAGHASNTLCLRGGS